MKKKAKYVVSLFDSFTGCVFSRVVSSRSAVEAVTSFVLTLSVSIGRDGTRFNDSEFTVSCRPYVDSDSLGGD